MSVENRDKHVFEKEYEMWKAASERDIMTFIELVADDAVMICGGHRCLGLNMQNILRSFT